MKTGLVFCLLMIGAAVCRPDTSSQENGSGNASANSSGDNENGSDASATSSGNNENGSGDASLTSSGVNDLLSKANESGADVQNVADEIATGIENAAANGENVDQDLLDLIKAIFQGGNEANAAETALVSLSRNGEFQQTLKSAIQKAEKDTLGVASSILKKVLDGLKNSLNLGGSGRSKRSPDDASSLGLGGSGDLLGEFGKVFSGVGTAAKDVITGKFEAAGKLFEGVGDISHGDVFGALKNDFQAGVDDVKGYVGGIQALGGILTGGAGAKKASTGTSGSPGTGGFSFKL